MGVLGTYTARTLARNPVRTAATVAGIALACALVLSVVTSALSLYRYVVDVEVERNGAYNAVVLGADADDLATASAMPGVARVAAVEREGFALVNPSNLITPYVAVEGVVRGEGGALEDLLSLRNGERYSLGREA